MYCFKCGKKINKDMQFCPYCGSKTIVEAKGDKTKNDKAVVEIEESEVKEKVKREIDYSAVIKKTGTFLYDYRKLFIEGLSLVLLLLFFCPFMKISLFGVTITEVNGFQAIINLFKGDFIQNALNGEVGASLVQNLITFAYIIYFVIAISLLSIIGQNLFSFFKTKENVNKNNFRNFVMIQIFSIALVVLFYVIKNELIKVSGQAFSFTGGTIAIMVVALLPCVYSAVCRFAKLNQENPLNENINFTRTHSSTICLFFVVAIFTLFLKVICLPINEQHFLTLLEYGHRLTYTYLVFVGLGLISTITLTFLNLNKQLHMINILTNSILIFLVCRTGDYITMTGATLTTLYYLPIVIFGVSILYSLVYFFHMFKLEKHDSETQNYKAKVKEYNATKPRKVKINEIWTTTTFFVGVALCAFALGFPFYINFILWGIGIVAIITSVVAVLIIDKKQCEFKLKSCMFYRLAIALPLLIATIIFLPSNISKISLLTGVVALIPYFLIIAFFEPAYKKKIQNESKTFHNSKFIKYTNLVLVSLCCIIFAAVYPYNFKIEEYSNDFDMLTQYTSVVEDYYKDENTNSQNALFFIGDSSAAAIPIAEFNNYKKQFENAKLKHIDTQQSNQIQFAYEHGTMQIGYTGVIYIECNGKTFYSYIISQSGTAYGYCPVFYFMEYQPE